MSLFRLSPRLNLSLEHTSVRKTLFLSAFSCSDSRFSSGEIDQKLKIGGIIGYGDSYLEVFFVNSKYSDYIHYYMMLPVPVHGGKSPV